MALGCRCNSDLGPSEQTYSSRPAPCGSRGRPQLTGFKCHQKLGAHLLSPSDPMLPEEDQLSRTTALGQSASPVSPPFLFHRPSLLAPYHLPSTHTWAEILQRRVVRVSEATRSGQHRESDNRPAPVSTPPRGPDCQPPRQGTHQGCRPTPLLLGDLKAHQYVPHVSVS